MVTQVGPCKDEVNSIVEQSDFLSCPILYLNDDATVTSILDAPYWANPFNARLGVDISSPKPQHWDQKAHFLDALNLSPTSELSDRYSPSSPSGFPTVNADRPSVQPRLRTTVTPSATQLSGQINPPAEPSVQPVVELARHSEDKSEAPSKPGTNITRPRSPVMTRSKSIKDTTRPPPKKRKAKTNLDLKKASPQQLAKRERYLERNRVAASKCRRQGKARRQELEHKARTLSKTHKQLIDWTFELREELLALKNQVLMHVDCDCSLIREHLQKEARRISLQNEEQLDCEPKLEACSPVP